jgi:AcrR family transcriptional regulator
MDVYVGKILERAIRRQKVSISEVSKRMGVSRRTLYNWFGQATLDKDILCAVGVIIKHDFTEDFGADYSIGNPQNTGSDQGHHRQSETYASKEQMDYWIREYIILLNEYNKLIGKAQDLL